MKEEKKRDKWHKSLYYAIEEGKQEAIKEVVKRKRRKLRKEELELLYWMFHGDR